ncbi:MAG: hypothetical protein MUC87_09240 [Bacteroidia bacterium]|jgi:hypothetical protein|nr:hypothetical protein [Bacteroidia bacterium]
MKQKKIRGHKRRWKHIENWGNNNTHLNLTDYLLNKKGKYHTKISVRPWYELSLTHSINPEPKGKTKQKILAGLIDIYENLKTQLDKLGQPYYLKIWLFEPRFSQSQVVCAIGDNIGFYENAFFKPPVEKNLIAHHYGNLNPRLEKLNWDYRLDEDHYDKTAVGEPEFYKSRQDYEDTKKWFEKLLKNPHRTYSLTQPNSESTETYSFNRGNVWIGGQK